MSTRFYAAWALAVVLALVVPVAIPFALWPPREGRHYTDDLAECGRRAENDAARETPLIWMPLSSDVHVCERDASGALVYVADVQARGPFGIPYASGSVDRYTIHHLNEHRGMTLGVAALLGGAIAASVPFALFWLLSARRDALLPAT